MKKEISEMTEQEFYELKCGDEVEYNGDRYKFVYNFGLHISDGIHVTAKMFKGRELEMFVYQYDEDLWYNSSVLSDYKTLGNLKLIKSHVPTIDQQIQETKSQIEKLQNELKKLESQKNSKRIEQLISEMVPGKFYTIKYTNQFYPNGRSFTGKMVQGLYKDCLYIEFEDRQVVIVIKSIIDIIPREDITNDYNNLMEKIKNYNGE